MCWCKNTHITAKSITFTQPPSYSELPRFTVKEQSEECAFSGQIDFSRNGKGKNREKMNSARKKEEKHELSEIELMKNSWLIDGNSCW